MRTLLVLACLIVVASAFVQPGTPLRGMVQKVPMARATGPDMVVGEVDAVATTLSSVGTTLATNSGDFGGMTIPIIGLGLLAAIIGILAGPVED